MNRYSHTQGSPMKWFMGGVVLALIAAAAMFSDGGLTVLGPILIAAGLIAFLTLIFSRLTVDVVTDHVRIAFGAGWPAKTIRLDDIASVTVVRDSWWYGWGIRWIPRGGLWNVWGLDAVELELTTGKRFRIGTDQPDALVAALPAR